MNRQQLSLAGTYSVNHLKHLNLLPSILPPDNAELFSGGIINIIPDDDYLVGLKLAKFWLGLPKVHRCSNG